MPAPPFTGTRNLFTRDVPENDPKHAEEKTEHERQNRHAVRSAGGLVGDSGARSKLVGGDRTTVRSGPDECINWFACCGHGNRRHWLVPLGFLGRGLLRFTILGVLSHRGVGKNSPTPRSRRVLGTEGFRDRRSRASVPPWDSGSIQSALKMGRYKGRNFGRSRACWS